MIDIVFEFVGHLVFAGIEFFLDAAKQAILAFCGRWNRRQAEAARAAKS